MIVDGDEEWIIQVVHRDNHRSEPPLLVGVYDRSFFFRHRMGRFHSIHLLYHRQQLCDTPWSAMDNVSPVDARHHRHRVCRITGFGKLKTVSRVRF